MDGEGSWSRGERLALLGIAVAMIGVVGAFLVPEVRAFLRLGGGRGGTTMPQSAPPDAARTEAVHTPPPASPTKPGAATAAAVRAPRVEKEPAPKEPTVVAGYPAGHPRGRTNVKVTTDRPCWVALLPNHETEGLKYGWWTAWHAYKRRGEYYETPHNFQNVAAGTYTLVVYDPASKNYDPNSGNDDQTSDGIVVHRVVVDGEPQSFVFVRDDFKAWNCLSCPWLYVWNGTDWIKLTEILKDVVGASAKKSDRIVLPAWAVADGKVRLRIVEEKDEITSLDKVTLESSGAVLLPHVVGNASGKLHATDDSYMELRKGEGLEFEFTISASVKGHAIILVANGFYDPDRIVLDRLVEQR